MRTARWGDRVRVHYVIRSQDGSVDSSRGRPPLELTVGARHPRLPGLGLALVGLRPGEATTVVVPPERGHGPHDPARVRRCSPWRFAEHAALQPGDRVRVTDGKGRRRLVRVLQVSDKAVLIDANRRWAGQTLELEVELVAIETSNERIDSPADEAPPRSGSPRRAGVDHEERATQARAFAFDLDADSLASLHEAFPGWQIEAIHGASAASLAHDWDPASADLLIVGIRAQRADALGLCRFLAFCTSIPARPRRHASLSRRRGNAPLLVLVPAGQETLVGAALEAGAHSCLVLPVTPADIARMAIHALAGGPPCQPRLSAPWDSGEDLWRDDGGEG